MTAQVAKVIATLYGAVRHPVGAGNGVASVMIEATALFGTEHRSAKFSVDVIGARSEQEFRDTVKDAIVTECNTRWTGESFQPRDIMLFGL